MDIVFEESSSTGLDLSVAHAELCKAITPGGHVVLHTTGVSVINLGFLQLVEAARRHAEAINCGFALSAPANDTLCAALERAGFLTAHATADIEFWHHGESTQ